MRSQFSDSVPVKVQPLSGFDKGNFHLLSAKVGTLVPVLCDELIPGSRVNLRQAISLSMPPLASDVYMKCDLKLEAFFVPMRICYGGFESWFADKPSNQITAGEIYEVASYIPRFNFNKADFIDSFDDTWNWSNLAHSVLYNQDNPKECLGQRPYGPN